MIRFLFAILFCVGISATAQEVASRVTVENTSPQTQSYPDYVLGPGDQIRIHVVNVDEVPKDPIVVGLDGFVSLPFVGRVKIGGLTTAQAEAELDKLYRQYLLRPDISISVVEFQSQPVSVLGAVKTPGVQQVRGSRTVVEMLSSAGGLTENAGSRLKITRRMEWGPLPLPNTKNDASGQYSVAEISLKSLFEARNPEENILIKPNDTLSVPVADTVYVIGHVMKAGPFVVGDQDRMTVLQAVSMAGGLDKLAQPKHARILRRQTGKPERTEIAVNLADVLEGKSSDFPMQADDILYVPNNLPKSALLRTLDVAIQMGTGVVVWNRY